MRMLPAGLLLCARSHAEAGTGHVEEGTIHGDFPEHPVERSEPPLHPRGQQPTLANEPHHNYERGICDQNATVVFYSDISFQKALLSTCKSMLFCARRESPAAKCWILPDSDSLQDCWVALNGKVYDLSSARRRLQGGEAANIS